MSGNFHTSEYTEETNKMINCKIKSTLREIHKLKRKNLVLSDLRKCLQTKTGGEIYVYGSDIREDMRLMCELSERIGKNGNKIQRLRTKTSQLKKALVPAVDE